ncbi:beta-ketoacyl synthase N-terminal-like domain-containing protein [Streptomyces sp. V2I9]|uniref:beta-ketoacyl synthase N-terminal-like domain-containing protein n=1 Tax=Streptomyces sp. V2I9 TaxID=3042304 RepID=UPI0027827AC9|nr:beta-ketoacyl synthase N-terminal-like domain-containing protein [Streptomyces sp. V2I9]MDQ0988600.1 3-oxoacyl-(acyl-carrier-protein) synthase/thioesterase domain-containing protein/SAM-dependent methyltransferase/acyl carrier protein [Streptomyces sp. V2I9]
MKQLLLDFLWSHLRTLGAFRASGQTPDAARESAGLAPGFRAWFDECLRLFERAGYIDRRDGGILLGDATRHRPIDQLWHEWETGRPAWQGNPDLAATHLLVETTLRAFPDILTGRRPATEVIFPGGSLELVQNAYATNPASAFFNQVLADDLVARLRRRAQALTEDAARILEIGAGTGATSAVVLEALRSARLDVREYCYTDISRVFLNHAERSFGADNPWLTCGILDIERPVADQGLTLGGYDAVVAANVLHATRDIRHTLRNAKALLRPGGLLVLNELTANNLLSQFSFGLLDGWWRFEDPHLRIQGSPLLSTAHWRHVLTQEGFRAIALPARDAEDLGQQIIVAESDGVIRQTVTVPRPSAPHMAPVRESGALATAGHSAGSEPAEPLRLRIEAVALDVLAEALDIPRTRIGRDEPFSNYGLDSIFAVNVARTLGGTLGVDLDITVLFEHNTLAELGEFIVSEYAEDLRDALPPEPAPPDRAPDPVRPRPELDGMAVVGMAARFPGADDVDAFWQLVEHGGRRITAPPEKRADWTPHGDEAAALRGGFLDGVHEFDPLFFRMSMTEARQVTPELRLLLMTSWNAVEDAGYRPAELRSRPTGVFVATTQSEYRPAAMDLMSLPSPAMVPNRISYLLDLNGPSEQCDTTCSSSFVALHRAIRSIRDGECEQALVGGVNLVMSPAGFGGMRAAGMLSPSGDVRPFQQGADGTARGEGVAAVLIKPLSRALEDGDVVHCVVRGTGVAHGGRGVSFTAPNIRGMKTAVTRAYADAAIDPGAVDYIETHGMSSMLADSAELAALGAGQRSGDDSADVTYLGNVKPCIGHTEVVSGLAALVKTAQAMRHGVIPALPGFGRLHPDLSLKGTRLRIPTQNLPWPERTDDAGRPLPRRASMHSFGIGGVNAHVVLEQHIASAEPDDDPGAQVLVLSARSADALRERARRLTHRLAGADPRSWADIAYTLQVGREAMSCRLAFVARSTDEAARVLGGWLDGDPDTLARVAFAEDVGTAAGPEYDGEPARLDHVAEQWAAGVSVDWALMHRGARRRRITLPGYPFARLTCFAEQAPRPDQASHSGAGPLDGEAFVADLVASVLGLPRHEIDGTRSLADYGLNSLLLVAMLGRISQVFPDFQPAWWQPHDTLDDVVARLSKAEARSTRVPAPELVRLNGATEGRPVFWIHGALAGVESYRTIAERIDRPFYGIQARGLLTEDAPIEGVTAMAEYYTEVLRSVQPEGPYDVGGFCLGGIVAYEVTRRLQAEGQDVASLTMVDSPDGTGLAKSNANGFQSARSAALQVVNSLLWPAGEKDPAVLRARLVHRDEVVADLDEDAFVLRLAELAAERGLAMRPAQIARFVRRNMAIQLAYRLGEHTIRPLPRPEGVVCTYFRNRRGLFLGEVEPYFQVAGETFSLDHVDYQQDWAREMPGLRLVEIDAANHMTILNDAGPLSAIEETCMALYASDEIGVSRG